MSVRYEYYGDLSSGLACKRNSLVCSPVMATHLGVLIAIDGDG